MKIYLGISVLLMLATLQKGDENLELSGSNVCNEMEHHKIEIHTPIEEHPDERESDWCSTPTTFSRCSDTIPKTKSIFLIQYKTKTITHAERKQCCDGYGKNKKGNQCLPICDCIDVTTPTCNDITDDCNCIVGEECLFKCPSQHYGENCSQNCSCKHGKCHHISGECICASGWLGPSCNKSCDDGFYGKDCKEVCKCKSDKFICNASLGCICRGDLEGDDCDVPLKTTIVTEKTTIVVSVVVVSIILILILVSVTVFVIRHYRRRIRNLRTATAQVEYHKENPGYGRNLNLIDSNTSKQCNPTNRNNNTYSKLAPRSKILIPVKINPPRPLVDVDADHLYEEIDLKRNDYDHLEHRSINSVKPHYLNVSVERNNFAMCQVESPVDNELQSFVPFGGSLLD